MQSRLDSFHDNLESLYGENATVPLSEVLPKINKTIFTVLKLVKFTDFLMPFISFTYKNEVA